MAGLREINGVEAGRKAFLTSASTIAIDATQAQVFEVTLTGNATFSVPTGMAVGVPYYLIIKQDGTGSRLGTFTGWYDVAAMTLSTAASSVDVINFWTDGTIVLGTLTKAYVVV